MQAIQRSDATSTAFMASIAVATVGGTDDSECPGLRLDGTNEDLCIPECVQAPLIIRPSAQWKARSESPPPGAEIDTPARLGSEQRNSGSNESDLDFRQSIYVDARDESSSEGNIDDERKRYSTGMWDKSAANFEDRSLTLSDVLSRHARFEISSAFSALSLPARRHSSAPHPSEARETSSTYQPRCLRLKPLVLTPSRTLSTPLTGTGTRARQDGVLQGPYPSRRYSTPDETATVASADAGSSESSALRPERSNASIRRRSIGYHGESASELTVVKRSGSTSSESTLYSSDFSRRGSADSCDTDATDLPSSPERFCYTESNRLPSLQKRFDPQRGLNLDVVLETDDDLLEMPSCRGEEAGAPTARYRDFWGEEAARNESAFQDVCTALDELAPAFPISSASSSQAFTPSASPLSRSGSSASDRSSSIRAARRGKPIVIKPVRRDRVDVAGDVRRNRRVTRNRLSAANEAANSPPLPTDCDDVAISPRTDAPQGELAKGGPVSSADFAATAAPKRAPRPFVWPPPHETKRLSLAPALAYESESDSDSDGISGAESDEKAELHSRRSFVPRPPRTRGDVEVEAGDFLDFLLNESPTAPSKTTILLDSKATPTSDSTGGSAVAPKRKAPPPRAPAATSPRSKGLTSRFLKPFSSSAEVSPQQPKKRPINFALGRSKPTAHASASPVRPRPVISGPLELEAIETLCTTSAPENVGSVTTISLAQAQKMRSASNEGRRRPNSPTTSASAAGGFIDPDSVSEELLTLYTDISPPYPASVKNRSPCSIPLPPSPTRGKQLPAPPLLLSPLWALPVTDLPRTPLAWAEKPLRRTSSTSSVATNGTTIAIVNAYA
ncbi:hypothetical protein JCM3774_004853 [Rhodotorula dairenensis]